MDTSSVLNGETRPNWPSDWQVAEQLFTEAGGVLAIFAQVTPVQLM